MNYGQIAISDGEQLHCLDRTSHQIGEVYTWPDGRAWELVARFDNPLAGGYHCGIYCAWWLGREVRS